MTATLPPIALKKILDEAASRHNRLAFIADDPISVPHRFSRLQDIEIMGFWTAMLAWGRRTAILQKAGELVERMDGAPFEFVTQHQERDLHRFVTFKHRTFQPTDTLYFIHFFKNYYAQNDSLEEAFARHLQPDAPHVGAALAGFHHLFFDDPLAPDRTRKHVANPQRGSSCKRLNLFLRWMVRRDAQGVDFGLWQRIAPRQLLLPLDVHVERTARRLGLLTRQQSDWKAVLELTENLRQFDANDPAKYDFALFGLGLENYQNEF